MNQIALVFVFIQVHLVWIRKAFLIGLWL